MSVAVATSDAALRALAPEWEALWRRVPGAVPFQSPAWLLPWWDVFGTGRPVVACLRDGERLAGILPLYVLDEPAGDEPPGDEPPGDGPAGDGPPGHGPGGRKLLPIGVGLSDYLDALLEPDAAPGPLLEAALRAGAAAGAAVCDLVDVPPGSLLRGLAAPPGWRASWHDGDPCPTLRIADGAGCAEDAVPARQRRKLRMNRHRADRLGGWAVEFAAPATLMPMLDGLWRLAGHRWGEDAGARAFLGSGAPGLLAAGLLRLASLSIGGQVAATCLALGDPARLMFYKIGFDPAFAAASPGSLLVGAMMDAAIADGCREVHFLRGNEAYKYAWGALDRHNAGCRLQPA